MAERREKMSIHVSYDPDKEIKQRIKMIDRLRDNLIDLQAEYEEAVKMDPNTSTKGEGDKTKAGKGESVNKIIVMSLNKENLEKRIRELEIIIHDYDRGWNLLNDEERELITAIFKDGRKQEQVAKERNMNRSTVYRKVDEALRKMKSEQLHI